MNNFTPRAQQVLALARKEADRFNHNYVGTEHLLLGLIKLGQGVAVNVLTKLGLDLETVRLHVEQQVGSGPETKMVGNIPYTPRVKKVLALASKEAKALNHSYVGTEHILLGLLREGEGVAAQVLRTLDVNLDKARNEILRELDPNFACEITPVVREASMSATKTSNAVGPVAIGGSVVFTLTVTNEGPSTVLAGTTLVDDLPAGLNLISINAPGWTCNAVDPVVCEYGSVLAVGETAPPIQITTTVATGASGTITNTGVFTGIVDVEELDPAELARVEQVPVVVTATAVASAVAVIQVRSGGTIPETGADSLGWLPVASLLVGVGLFGLLIARRRRPAALR